MTLLEQEDMLKDTFSSVTLWIACQKLCPYVMEEVTSLATLIIKKGP